MFGCPKINKIADSDFSTDKIRIQNYRTYYSDTGTHSGGPCDMNSGFVTPWWRELNVVYRARTELGGDEKRSVEVFDSRRIKLTGN